MSEPAPDTSAAVSGPAGSDAGAASMPVRLVAEFVGTFVLVLFGCGAAVLAATAQNPDRIQVGIGYLGVALAFGLAVTVMAYAVGHLSGGHFNPAITIGLAVAGRVEKAAVPLYIAVQILGASSAGGVLFLIAAGKPGADPAATGFATNGYGARSPEHYSLVACLITEIVMTAVFVSVVLGTTDDRAPQGFAPLAIGLTLVVIHLVTIPVTNTSVNPARTLGVAWYVGAPALTQVWLFLAAPVAGALLAGLAYPRLTGAGHAAAEAAEARVERTS